MSLITNIRGQHQTTNSLLCCLKDFASEKPLTRDVLQQNDQKRSRLLLVTDWNSCCPTPSQLAATTSDNCTSSLIAIFHIVLPCNGCLQRNVRLYGYSDERLGKVFSREWERDGFYHGSLDMIGKLCGVVPPENELSIGCIEVFNTFPCILLILICGCVLVAGQAHEKVSDVESLGTGFSSCVLAHAEYLKVFVGVPSIIGTHRCITPNLG